MSGPLAYIDATSGAVTWVTQDKPLPIGTVDVTITDVTLDAGSNIIGKVGIDQTTPGTTNAVVNTEKGDSYSHITTSTTTTVKGSAGTIKKVIVNTLGTVASTCTVKDGSTTLAVIDTLTAGGTGTYDYNIACATSIVVVTTGAPDITVTYQ
jgi:hypothetical protein